MNQRFDMIWFGRMGLNREGKTATQGCETKRGAHRKGPYTHFFWLVTEGTLTEPVARSRGSMPAVDPRVLAGSSRAEAPVNFSSSGGSCDFFKSSPY